MPQSFDPDTLKTWDQTNEIDIETSRGDGAPVHRTTIWIVVDGNTGYVRSVRGPAGRWYRERWPGPTAAMLRDETLPTTLRLDPA